MSDKSVFLPLLNDYVNTYLPVGIGVQPNTIKSYKYAFRLLIEFMYEKHGIAADVISFENLDYDTLTGFFEWILTERKCSETTRNQRLAALLSFSKYAQNRDFDAAAVFRNSIIRIPLSKPRGKRRTWFTAEEMKILLALPDDRTAIGLRDKMILTTLYVTGTRSQELCDLTVSCVRKKKDRTAIELNGKGDKSRLVNVSEVYATMLDSYLRKKRIHGISDRHIFSSQTHEHMTISCVEEIVKKYVNMAKEQHPELFTMGTYTPHSFRHSTATHMLEAGVPLMAIKKFLGHASIQTTQVYAELSQNTVDKYVKEWNEKWFPKEIHTEEEKEPEEGNMPSFLNI